MTAAGAWKIPKAYQQGMSVPDDQWPRVHLATVAIQRELIRQGYLVADVNKLDGGFGAKTNFAIRAFQSANHLSPDGAVGRLTAKALWGQLIVWWESALGIPDHLLYGQAYLESGLDPGAEGDNPKGPAWYDRGLVQINRHFHPEVSDAQAYGDVGFCVEWSGDRLLAAYRTYRSWDPAIANHNSPALAKQWCELGRAPNLQIARYVELVRAAALK